MKQEREQEFRTWAAAILVYAATAIAGFVLPLGRRFGKGLLGTALFAHDSIFNAGILEWGYRSLWSPRRHIFEWTAGFPLHDSLATTENLIGWQIFNTPLRLLVGPVASYNILVVISFVLSGLGAALFARRFGADRWGAVIAGFVFAFVPFHLNHVIHIQTMAVCYCPLALYFLDRFLSEVTFRNAIGLSVACLMTPCRASTLACFCCCFCRCTRQSAGSSTAIVSASGQRQDFWEPAWSAPCSFSR